MHRFRQKMLRPHCTSDPCRVESKFLGTARWFSYLCQMLNCVRLFATPWTCSLHAVITELETVPDGWNFSDTQPLPWNLPTVAWSICLSFPAKCSIKVSDMSLIITLKFKKLSRLILCDLVEPHWEKNSPVRLQVPIFTLACTNQRWKLLALLVFLRKWHSYLLFIYFKFSQKALGHLSNVGT